MPQWRLFVQEDIETLESLRELQNLEAVVVDDFDSTTDTGVPPFVDWLPFSNED